jgi:hypothetical protein
LCGDESTERVHFAYLQPRLVNVDDVNLDDVNLDDHHHSTTTGDYADHVDAVQR